MGFVLKHEYIKVDNVNLFTFICVPSNDKK